jgi:hypothetical protein
MTETRLRGVSTRALLCEPAGDDGAPFKASGAAGTAAKVARAAGARGLGEAAGGAAGQQERDGEEGADAATARSRAHLDGELPPEATMCGPRTMLELCNGVGVFVAKCLDSLLVARDVAAEADAVAFLVAVAGLEGGDLKAHLDAVAEGEPVEVEGDGFGVERERVISLCGPRMHALGEL